MYLYDKHTNHNFTYSANIITVGVVQNQLLKVYYI